MAAIVSIISRHSLTIEVRHRKHPNKSKLALYKPLLHYYNHLKQLYISKKMEHFSYKGGCGIHRHMHISKRLKQELAWDTDERFWISSNIMLLETVRYTTKILQNKAI